MRNAAAPSQSDVSQRLRQRQWEPSEFHHPSARQLDAPAVFAECQLQRWQPDMSKTTWACRVVPNARCCSRTKRARVLVVENLANPRVNNQKSQAGSSNRGNPNTRPVLRSVEHVTINEGYSSNIIIHYNIYATLRSSLWLWCFSRGFQMPPLCRYVQWTLPAIWQGVSQSRFHLELIKIVWFYGDLVTKLHILPPYWAMFEPYCHTVMAVYVL